MRPDQTEPSTDEHERSEQWLTPGVLGVGAASLCSDSSHELVTSLLPTFLSSTLHAGPGLLGVIESISDALTGLSKLAGGPLAADPRRRARLASSGYLGTAVATAAIGLTTAVWQVAVLRAVAWVSRGIRSPARDLVLTSLARSDRYGRAFGVERFGDNAGAVVGPLLAAGLVGVLGVRHTILLAIVPGLLAALAILIAAREARRNLGSPAARRGLGLNLAALRRAGVVRLLIPVAMFELGNVATTMLILRATDLLRVAGSGAPTRTLAAATSLAVLLYAGHNVAAALAALLAGRVADSTGRPRLVLGIGAALYLVGYGVFAVGPHGWPVLLGGFLMAGAGIGFAEPAESVLLARGLPEELRAHGFGLLGLVQALADLGSTAVVGALWAGVSAAVGFGYATGWMLLAVIGCLVVRTRFRSESPGSDGAADPDPAQ